MGRRSSVCPRNVGRRDAGRYVDGDAASGITERTLSRNSKTAPDGCGSGGIGPPAHEGVRYGAIPQCTTSYFPPHAGKATPKSKNPIRAFISSEPSAMNRCGVLVIVTRIS